VPLGRLETPEDVARVAMFLASSDAGYITGDAIEVTGWNVLGTVNGRY
jgi:NAD(P)-dependent dehydrogenase (short-subunit alcohol dehydrogenase family)